MPDIVEAYNLAVSMGRKTDNLVCSSDRDGDCYYSGTVTSPNSDEPYQSIIAFNSAASRHLARWHCTCRDFQFTFYPYIKEQGENLGEFPVVQGVDRKAPRHINEYGMCKHVMKLYEDIFDG